MTKCQHCEHKHHCRVPGDLQRFSRVIDWLSEDGRAPNLQQRLRYYVDKPDCLVEAGCVDL